MPLKPRYGGRAFHGALLRRCWPIVLVAVLSGCLSTAKDVDAVADDSGYADLEPVSRELMAWIGENTSYDVGPLMGTLPEVSFCNCGDVIWYEGRTLYMDEPIQGVYDMQLRRITLVRPWSRKELLKVSTLLHELVHYVQYQSRQWPCWRATEWEAYKLQERWLLERGVDPGFNWAEIFLRSRCAPEIHK